MATKKPGPGAQQNMFLKELAAFEKRLDTKIEGVEKRLDAKFDSKIDPLDGKMNSTEQRLNERIDGIGAKIVMVELTLNARSYAVEQRLESKIDSSRESMKEYMDSRISQLDPKFAAIDARFDTLKDELQTSTKGIVDLIERRSGDVVRIDTSLGNHEQRITALEGRA